MSEKTEKLVFYIDRWLQAFPRRSLSMLARISGVSYPTLRRIMQQDCVPSLDNTIAVLNRVASLHESIQYFEDHEPIKDFCERFQVYARKSPTSEDYKVLVNRDRFWIIVLAITLGVSKKRVEKLLGKFGLLEFHRMIREGLLREESLGYYRPTSASYSTYIDSGEVSKEVTKHIAEAPVEHDCLRRFLTYNVNEETYLKMRREIVACYNRLDQLAKNNQGSLVVVSALSILNVFAEDQDAVLKT